MQLWEEHDIPELVEALLGFNYNGGESLLVWLQHNGATEEQAQRCVGCLKYTLRNSKGGNDNASCDNQ